MVHRCLLVRELKESRSPIPAESLVGSNIESELASGSMVYVGVCSFQYVLVLAGDSLPGDAEAEVSKFAQPALGMHLVANEEPQTRG